MNKVKDNKKYVRYDEACEIYGMGQIGRAHV